MLGGLAQPGSNQQRAEPIAVQAHRMRLVVQAGAADMSGRGMLEQLFLHRVLIEPRHSAQAPGDSGPGAAAGLEIPGEALDISTARLEQSDAAPLAPGRCLAAYGRLLGEGVLSGGRGVAGLSVWRLPAD